MQFGYKTLARQYGVTDTSIRNWHKKLGCTEETLMQAINLAIEHKKKRNGNIEYNGEFLTIRKIAELIGKDETSLGAAYRQNNNNIYLAILFLLKRERTTYEAGKTITEIARESEISRQALTRNLEKTETLSDAIELSKENKERRQGIFILEGKRTSINKQAKKAKISPNALSKWYRFTKNSRSALIISRYFQEVRNGTIDYKGIKTTLKNISREEEICYRTLKTTYELYKDIQKSIMICKMLKARKRKLSSKATIQETAQDLNTTVLELEHATKTRTSLKSKKSYQKHSSDQTLRQYCIEHSYNYRVIQYGISHCGKKPENAIEDYLKNGQKMPVYWIYEKYGVLLSHFILKFQLDSKKVMHDMKNNPQSLEQIISKHTFKRINKDLKPLELEWTYELYETLDLVPLSEWKEYIDTFLISEKEIKIILESQIIINQIKREITLYEVAQVLSSWTFQEIIEVLELYEVTKEEVKVILEELYHPFKEKVLKSPQELPTRQDELSELEKIWYTLTDEKKQIYQKQYRIIPEEYHQLELKSKLREYLINYYQPKQILLAK